MGRMKYDASMGYTDLNRNSLDIGFYFTKTGKKGGYSGLKMVGSWPDVTFFVDADGNIWSEYVPTYD